MRRRRSSNVNNSRNTAAFMNEASLPHPLPPAERFRAAAVLMVFSHDLDFAVALGRQ